jgi:hypothetical protein
MRPDNGKGDKPRPFTDKEQFDKNWDNIFKNPVKEDKPFGLDNVVDETDKHCKDSSN